jgi:hypothetical protein
MIARMAFDPNVLANIDSGYASTAFWRVVVILAVLLVLACAWRLARRRWAPRSIANWRGKGIHPGLSPLEAGLLLRAHPTLLVAIALEPYLVSGKARFATLNPLSIEWPERPAAGPLDEALSSCVSRDGRIASGGVIAFLDALYEAVNEKMTPYSGRETAVHYRRHVTGLWDRVLREGAVADADRPWLMLHDPATVVHRIRRGPGANALHDLIRLGGVFSAHLLPAQSLAEQARGARSGYFGQRADLALVDAADPTQIEKMLLPCPFLKGLGDLAELMDGEVTDIESLLPILLTYTTRNPGVSGRYHGRTSTVTPGRGGEVEIHLASSVGRRFQVIPSPARSSTEALSAEVILSGDEDFDASFAIHHIDCPEFESWLALPGFLDAIRALPEFIELAGTERMLRLRHAYDPETFTARTIHDRFSGLLSLAENLEQRVTMAPRPPPEDAEDEAETALDLTDSDRPGE